MEEKIYEILKKHKLPLKKREDLMVDLLNLFSVIKQSEHSCGHKWKDFGYGQIDVCDKCGKWKWGE